MPAPSENSGRAILWGPLLLVAAVVGFGLGGASIYFYLHYVTREEEKDTQIEASAKPKTIVAQGRIEPKDGIRQVGVPTPDRIRRLPEKTIYEGAKVEKEQTLAILDSEALRKLELKLAEIQREQALKRRDAIEKNGIAQMHVEQLRGEQIDQLEPLEKEALKSKITFLESELKNAWDNSRRYKALGDTVAKQDVEKQDLLLQQTQAELVATQSQLKKLIESNKLKRKMAEAQLAAMRAELKQNLSAINPDLLGTHIEEAKERLKDTKIVAPCKGKILRIMKREGELIRGEPILEMANVDKMIAVAEVLVPEIDRVKKKLRATITTRIADIDKDPVTGTVYWIAGSVGKARVVPLDPRAAVDRHVIEVKIELDHPERVVDLIGHQVVVTIETEK